VTGQDAGGYNVIDPCNRSGWLAEEHVTKGGVPIDRDGTFSTSVFVVDPGHGYPDLGAVGPTGLHESEVALDVAGRTAALLGTPHNVDWATGRVLSGSEVPAATAVLTRSPNGPNSGDYELGLTFRAALANAVQATALVSIHLNSQPVTDLDHPGSEAYVSLANPESPRLGGLIVDELRRGLAAFETDWVGAPGDGVFNRVDSDGTDYYALLEHSQQPAALIEGAYISNPSEEALARTDEFRQAYAEAVYRGLVRFVTTEDDPIPAPQPQLWETNRPSTSMDDCAVPGY
jgi:N-acetylmuramoyl-L-alanine amidase